jgi:ketosteroid isomerase-like protein
VSDSIHTTPLQIAQRFLLHLGHDDFSEVEELVSPDIVYRVLGNHAFAGVFTGRDEVAAHLADLADRTKRSLDTVKWDDWLVGERHAAAIAHIHVQYRGKMLMTRALYVVGMDVDNAISSVTVFFEDEGALLRTLGPPQRA